MEILENKHIEDIKPTFSQDAIGFHQQLPGYTPTPLIDWPVYASQHHFKNLCIQDESQRFGLKAFKSFIAFVQSESKGISQIDSM